MRRNIRMGQKNQEQNGGRTNSRNRSNKQQKTEFSALTSEQRKRFLSSETSDIGEEAEVLLDAILGALSSKETMDRFVTALVGIPEIKAKLIEHLVPSLENRIAEVIQPLKQDIIQLEDKITETDMRTDDLEQYGRRHSLRISGIPESHKEHTDMLICEFLKNELNIEINMGNIDRSHRVGQKKPNLNRPIAVRFINYRLKEHVYANRMYLKKGYYINESLSKGRSSLFYKARQLKKQKLILDTWTRDGNIFVKTLDSTVKVCSRESQLPITFAPKTSVPKPFKTGQKPKPNEQEPAHKSNNAVIVTEVQVHSNPEPCTVNNGGEEIELLSSTVINTSDNV